MKKYIALCNFLHKGVDYTKHNIVALDEKEIESLLNAGLVASKEKLNELLKAEAEMKKRSEEAQAKNRRW